MIAFQKVLHDFIQREPRTMMELEVLTEKTARITVKPHTLQYLFFTQKHMFSTISKCKKSTKLSAKTVHWQPLSVVKKVTP